jgi:hypothetical protein
MNDLDGSFYRSSKSFRINANCRDLTTIKKLGIENLRERTPLKPDGHVRSMLARERINSKFYYLPFSEFGVNRCSSKRPPSTHIESRNPAPSKPTAIDAAPIERKDE